MYLSSRKHFLVTPSFRLSCKHRLKSEFFSLGRATTDNGYRMKLSGFRTEMTSESLTLRFGSHNYCVDPRDPRVGYVVKIQTMKYAKQLMDKWHNKEIGDGRIKCQLELNPTALSVRGRSRSPARSTDGEPKGQCFPNRLQDTRIHQNSQVASENVASSTEPKCEFLFLKAKTLVSSFIDRLPSDVPANEWEITNKAPNSDSKVLLIRGQVDRKRLAAIKVYPNQVRDDFHREVTAIDASKSKEK
jgi:hypothetical protein